MQDCRPTLTGSRSSASLPYASHRLLCLTTGGAPLGAEVSVIRSAELITRVLTEGRCGQGWWVRHSTPSRHFSSLGLRKKQPGEKPIRGGENPSREPVVLSLGRTLVNKGLPWWRGVKNPPAGAGDVGWISGLRRSLMPQSG